MLVTCARWSVARAFAGVSATDACAGSVVVPKPTCADAAYVGAWADASTAAAAPATIATTAERSTAWPGGRHLRHEGCSLI